MIRPHHYRKISIMKKRTGMRVSTICLLVILFQACGPCAGDLSQNDAGSLLVGSVDGGESETVCQTDDQCPFGAICRDNRCQPSDPNLHDEGCVTDSDCEEGFQCADSTGRCVEVSIGVDAPEVDNSECADGETRFCGTKVGACEYGAESCVDGSWSGVCEGGIKPAEEICDSIDNDCDGETDESFILGGACSDGFGACKQWGEHVCTADGSGTMCSAVGLDPAGRDELCGNLIDDDCDEDVDEGFELDVECSAGQGACFRSGVTICSDDGLSTVCTAQQGEAEETELCGVALDDDCDGEEEEGFEAAGETCSDGFGACYREGVLVCDTDQLSLRCTASAGLALTGELCGNGIDDDCDMETDEGFDALGSGCTLGEPPCEVSGTLQCSADLTQLECVPDLPTDSVESCNGLDDDADQCIDEDFDVGVSCVVGTGVCRNSGAKICSTDGTGTTCDATENEPNPAGELCGNSSDDDCDGDIDEGYPEVGESCSAGFGICERSGAMACSEDRLGVVCDAVPGEPNAVDLCGNGLDDDCNDFVDDGWDVGALCFEGDGICRRSGLKVCTADGLGTECSASPGAPNPDGELCGNEQDDDCDGEEDEGFDVGAPCTVGDGICEREGVKVCSADGLSTVCDAVAGPSEPLGELCGNNLDDDCDGFTDEGFGNLGDPCSNGLGACSAAGNYVCNEDLTGTTCDAVPGVPQTEICDNVDNDCNGQDDNGCDDDMDGYCDATMELNGLPDICPNTLSADLLDCQDNNASINPGATEICGDSVDSDCDGDPSNGCADCNPQVDADFDGSNECDDCDETNGSIYPGATELCDGRDNDCDDLIDEDFDSDNDTYTTCGTIPNVGGLSDTFIDCNDDNNTIHPFACELCALGSSSNTVACGEDNDQGNLVDEDCDGYVDELCFPCDPNDVDGDGFSECDGDCANDDSAVSPGLAEVCDGLDTDCNVTTVDNCQVGDDCNWPGDPPADQCSAGLLCAEELGNGGNTTGQFSCTSLCNSSPLGEGLGDGCTETQICGSSLIPSGNLHGCRLATDIGTLDVGQACSDDMDCRSGNCYRDQRQNGPPDKYCSDFCGSDAYCANGTKCMLWGSDSARCMKVISTQPYAFGEDCSGVGYCEAGTQACVILESSAEVCSDVCCTNSDCPTNYHCSLKGNENLSPYGGVNGSPVCWPNAGANDERQAGAACDVNEDCASEFCDKNLDVCVDLCCHHSTCPGGLSCEMAVVTRPSGNQTLANVCVNATPAEALERK